MGNWDDLSQIIGSNEVAELQKEYDDLDQSNWIVILYYNRKFCTIVTSEDPNCM